MSMRKRGKLGFGWLFWLLLILLVPGGLIIGALEYLLRTKDSARDGRYELGTMKEKLVAGVSRRRDVAREPVSRSDVVESPAVEPQPLILHTSEALRDHARRYEP